MSVIRKQPYIESLLGSMSTANLKDLRTILNSGGDNVSLSFATLTNSYKNKVTPVYFQFEDNGLKTGILIWTNSKCALICYHKYQDLLLIELDPTKHTYQKINEYCDINELRRVLDDTVESTGAIDSGNAAEGTVPIADGEGGVEWADASNAIKGANVEDGSAQYLLGLDASGNVIKDELPEGIVVDQTVVEDSANAVSGGAVYDELHDNYYDKTEIDAIEETKANVDGNYPTMTVGAADNLTPYDEESGANQNEPFNFQATGTANGSQSDFATGSLALMKEKRGNSVVVNQKIYNRDFADLTTWSNSSVTSSVSNGVLTLTSNGDSYGRVIYYGYTTIVGHKYLTIVSAKSDNVTECLFSSGAGWTTRDITNSWKTFYAIGEASNATNAFVLGFAANPTNGQTIQFKEPTFIDLTQWFGSNDNIPADLLAHPENWYRYFQGLLAYNAGQIVNANSRYIKCIGRQQWDEVAEEGYIDNNTGANASASGFIRSKNYIPVIPNARYAYYCGASVKGIFYFYDKDKNFITGLWANNRQEANSGDYFNVPSNALFIRFYTGTGYGGTYNHDITISLYYEGESGYDQYYPYEVLTNNDTGTEELLAFDYKTPDGTIHRNTINQNLGDLNWRYETVAEGVYAFTVRVADLQKIESLITTISSKYEGTIANMTEQKVLYYGHGYYALIYKDSNYTSVETFVQSINNVYMQYLTNAPTTEQGTPFSENLIIDDFGSMEFSGTSGVPQGNLIFYPVDYKAFVDTLYDYTEGTPSDLAKKSDLTPLESQDTILLNAIGGTLRQLLAISKTIDFLDTNFVDLGSLNWLYDSSFGGFVANSSDTFSTNHYALATLWVAKTTYSDAQNNDKSVYIGGSSNNQIFIHDTSFGTDATTFKNAVKGVLLAYEKASE